MNHTLKEATIALAGVFQATHLVQQIAQTGMVVQGVFDRSIRSIFETNPVNTEAVFGGTSGIQSGLKQLIEHLGNSNKLKNTEITKYIILIMHLERKLSKNPKMLQTLSDGIEKARAQAEFYSLTHENVLASLAGLYTETISTLSPRIMIQGEQGHLSNPGNANRIRALLLAAIRSTVLWRQCGGSRLQLLFKRKNILQEARKLTV